MGVDRRRLLLALGIALCFGVVTYTTLVVIGCDGGCSAKEAIGVSAKGAGLASLLAYALLSER